MWVIDERIGLRAFGGSVDARQKPVQGRDAPHAVAVGSAAQRHTARRALREVDLEAVGVEAIGCRGGARRSPRPRSRYAGLPGSAATGAPGGIRDALAQREPCGIPCLPPQQHPSPLGVALCDPAAQVGPGFGVDFRRAVRLLPPVVDDDGAGLELGVAKHREELVVDLLPALVGCSSRPRLPARPARPTRRTAARATTARPSGPRPARVRPRRGRCDDRRWTRTPTSAGRMTIVGERHSPAIAVCPS